MLPIANRVQDNAYTLHGERVQLPLTSPDGSEYLHGQGWSSPWKIADRASKAVKLELRQNRDPAGYEFRAVLTLELKSTGLYAQLQTDHFGARPRLYGLGFHPYFVTGPDDLLLIPAAGYFPDGPHYLPLDFSAAVPPQLDFTTARTIPDLFCNHCYSGAPGALLQRADGLRVKLTSTGSYLMLYHLPGGKFTALEPQTHPVNAANLPGRPGMSVLCPGLESLTFKFAVTAW